MGQICMEGYLSAKSSILMRGDGGTTGVFLCLALLKPLMSWKTYLKWWASCMHTMSLVQGLGPPMALGLRMCLFPKIGW